MAETTSPTSDVADLSGDSSGLHRIVTDLTTAARPRYQFRPGPANSRLAAAVLREGRLRPTSDLLADLFTVRPDDGRTRFLPKERLLSDDEKALAVAAFERAVRAGDMTSGPQIEQFEAALAGHLGLPEVIATSSGTHALVIALLAVGVGAGDEVIIPANSFAATENAVLAINAVPVLADVRSDFTLDPADVATRITDRTAAILPVHLYGKLADMPALADLARGHGLALVEDACQAIGVTGVGAHSDAVALSLNPFKNVGLCGKAGAVVTRGAELAARCRVLAYHGFAVGRKNVKTADFGFNARIDNTLAVIGLDLLPLAHVNGLRRTWLAQRYREALAPLAEQGMLGLPEFTSDHGWHLFAIQVLDGPSRDGLRDWLAEHARVETDVFYPVLTHRQHTPLRNTAFADVRLPVTEQLHERVLHLPLHQHLTLAEQDRTMEGLYAAFRAHR
ncbi:DegT/DnrJ/EryC1/StrS family aminotransferase [Micromonospora phaseoli]|uniref:DegT/DnrJ/EryC1/StrS family aminotransferase n=1 Tax=Micromonospora phaseoli TaxID=1144548 RepID=UPI0018E09CB3|nr:DegT/DnrJ/EryC1/StrS family aminotransferase [Micromonospora phaseoli]